DQRDGRRFGVVGSAELTALLHRDAQGGEIAGRRAAELVVRLRVGGGRRVTLDLVAPVGVVFERREVHRAGALDSRECRNASKRASSAQTASRIPAPAPRGASSALSVRSWRTTRARPAPSAQRTAISRDRAAPRASRRFATLAQAISSTSRTAPIRTSSGWRA